ncbi:MAG: hypothetical protein R3293_21205 [Candidatus Promineifilaceae bacterium]|nr:hypothetical protein [Candidatus Promineifilaceae bacterium]
MSQTKLITYTIILAIIPVVVTIRWYDDIYVFVNVFIDVEISSLSYRLGVLGGAFVITSYLLFRFDEFVNPPRRFKKKLSKLQRKVTRLQGEVYFLTVEEAEFELEDVYRSVTDLRELARRHDVAPSERQLIKLQNISSQVQMIENNIRDRKLGFWKHILRRVFQIIGILAEIIALVFPSAGLTISRASRIGQSILGRDNDLQLPPGESDRYLE